MEQNPKSALSDKARTNPRPNNFPANDQSIRVKFAKTVGRNNQSNASSTASVVPSVPPTGNTGASLLQRMPGQANNNSANTETTATPTMVGGNDTNVKPAKPGASKKPTSGAATRAVTNIQRPTTSVVPAHHSNSRHSVGSTDDNAGKEEAARSKNSLNRTHSSKSRKRLRKVVSRGARTPPRTKSGKKLKHKRSSSADKEKENLEPTLMKAEYESELHKITQILKAVSAFDATTSTGNAAVTTNASKARFKVTNLKEGGGSLSHKSMHRPLSTGELKQLISSITRVVSLHQLPLTDEGTDAPDTGFSSGVKKTSSSTQVKAKKVKKPKTAGASPAINIKENFRTRARISSRSPSKSRESVRKGRGKKKSEKARRKTSEESSISSTEKDPARNAAFLRKYFEESTRLADRQSSEEVVVGSAPASLPETMSSSLEAKQSKRSSLGNASATKMSSKKGSKATVPGLPVKKVSQPSPSGLQPSVKPFNLVGAEETRVGTKNSTGNRPTSPSRVYTTAEAIVKPIVRQTETNKMQRRNQFLANEKDSVNFSTTAFAGSPKPRSPIDQDEKNAATTANEGRPAAKTPIIDPTGNRAARQQQIKKIEEVINTKFKGNTDKMKSIWEKTPYLPMTHARFKDMVSRYGTSEGEETQADKRKRTVTDGQTPTPFFASDTAPVKSTTGSTEEPVAQLKGPPGYWPDSEMTMSTMYNRLNYDYKAGIRKEARQIRKRFRDDARSPVPRPLTTKGGVVESSPPANSPSVNEALKYYSGLIKRDANTK